MLTDNITASIEREYWKQDEERKQKDAIALEVLKILINQSQDSPRDIAELAYMYADEFMREREKDRNKEPRCGG